MKQKHVWSVNGTSYAGDKASPILEKKKDSSFDNLAGPVK